MTATTFRQALGPLARQLARDAGWNENTWDKAVSRGRALTDEERAGLRVQLAAHIKKAQALRRKL